MKQRYARFSIRYRVLLTTGADVLTHPAFTDSGRRPEFTGIVDGIGISPREMLWVSMSREALPMER